MAGTSPTEEVKTWSCCSGVSVKKQCTKINRKTEKTCNMGCFFFIWGRDSLTHLQGTLLCMCENSLSYWIGPLSTLPPSPGFSQKGGAQPRLQWQLPLLLHTCTYTHTPPHTHTPNTKDISWCDLLFPLSVILYVCAWRCTRQLETLMCCLLQTGTVCVLMGFSFLYLQISTL